MGMLMTGLRGLLAFQSAMNVTSHNLTNAQRDFYSRRRVDFIESMYHGGVTAGDVNRVYSEIASRDLQRTTSDFSMSEIAYDQLSQIERMLTNDKSSVGSSISETLKTLRELNNNVGSTQSRSSYLNMLNFLAGRFNAAGSQIEEEKLNVNKSINNIAATVSKITQEIAALNDQVVNSQGHDLDSILDKREEQVQELAKYIDFSSNIDEKNQLNISLNNGSALVLGNQYGTIQAIPNPSDSTKLLLQLNTTIGVSPLDVTAAVRSGQIAGLYNLQSTLSDAQNSLNRLALTFSNAINAQNKLGIDANGSWGGNIFNDINNSNYINQRILENTNNTGTESMTVSITDTNQLTISDYNLVFDTATHYVLTRRKDNVVVSSGNIGSLPQDIAADGFSISINGGSIVAGDSFIVSPTKSGASSIKMSMTDPKLLALAWAVKSEANQQNKGTGRINVDNIIDPTNSAFSVPGSLNPPIRIEFLTDTTYQLVDANLNSVIEGPINYDPSLGKNSVFPTPGGYDPGYTISLSGAIKAGDTFDIAYNNKMSGDNRNGMAMEDLYKKNVLQGSSMTFSSAYDSLSLALSLQTRSEKIDKESNKALYDHSFAYFKAVAGVDQVEETAELQRYYEAYQASAQIIQVAKSVFETVIQLSRG